MDAPKTIFSASKKFSSRVGTVVDTIVLHNTDANLRSALYTLTTGPRQVSAHYLIARDGVCYKLVELDKNAWHAGVAAWNRRSIGIELEATVENKGLTPEMEKTLIQLVKYLCSKFQIAQILPHRRVNPTQCPGHIWPTDAEFDGFIAKNFSSNLVKSNPKGPKPELKERA